MGNSTAGQIVGTLVGSVAGFMIGGPFGAAFSGMMLGASLGGTIGLWLDPMDAPAPPPLGDLGINSYVNNAPIPLAYGQVKAYGGAIWIGLCKTFGGGGGKGKGGGGKGGKGGGGSMSMYLEYAVAHCAGPIESYLQYYVNDKQVSELGDSGMDFTFTSYYGTGVQTVDPTIQSRQGTGVHASPPYLHTAYTVVQATYKDGAWATLPTIAAEIRGMLTEPYEYDANPIRVLYDFLTNVNDGVGYSAAEFNGDPDTPDSPWKIAADYCDSTFDYYDEETSTTKTVAKYRYSNFISDKTRGYDIVLDILLSCRGILRKVDGLWEPLIHSGFDVPEIYFSDNCNYSFVCNGVTTATYSYGTVSRIYSNFYDYPLDYFKNAFFVFNDSNVAIVSNGPGYIDLCEQLSSPPNPADTFIVYKDNIKAGSFSYSKTNTQEHFNKIRVEFINRESKNDAGEIENLYLWDVYDLDSEDIYTDYNLNYDDTTVSGVPNIKNVRLSGVKRKCQAMSLANYYMAFSKLNRLSVTFTTDLVGMLLGVGDVIAISHTVLGWEFKKFYVMNIEETDVDEFAISAIEYRSDVILGCFNIKSVLTSTANAMESVYKTPGNCTIVGASSLWVYNEFIIHWERPITDDSYFYGVDVYIDVSGTDDYIYWFSSSEEAIYYTSATDITTSINMVDAQAAGFPSSGYCIINDRVFSYSTGGTLTPIEYDSQDIFDLSTFTAPVNVYYYNYYSNYTANTNGYLRPDSLGKSYKIKVVSKNVRGVSSNIADAPVITKTVVNTSNFNYPLNDPRAVA